ncbi:MAG: COQ9 family protein [Rhodospirillales bacterium]
MTDTSTAAIPDADQEAAEAAAREKQARQHLLLALLPHVAFEGWSPAALHAGYADAGLSVEEGTLLFPGGAREIIEYWSDWADHRMLERAERPDFASLRVRDRIVTLMRARIEINGPWRESLRRALSFMALPSQAGPALACTWRTLNAIWYACGDTATDIGFYSKRLSLGGVYAAAVLYWLDDSSEDYADTWAFLDRRIDDLMRMPKLSGRLRDKLAGIFSPLPLRRRPASDS